MQDTTLTWFIFSLWIGKETFFEFSRKKKRILLLWDMCANKSVLHWLGVKRMFEHPSLFVCEYLIKLVFLFVDSLFFFSFAFEKAIAMYCCIGWGWGGCVSTPPYLWMSGHCSWQGNIGAYSRSAHNTLVHKNLQIDSTKESKYIIRCNVWADLCHLTSWSCCQHIIYWYIALYVVYS